MIEKTSGTIEIFQSSDGESIPFGRNWVHKIEEGLSHAKIMFVFVSENSINSSWIYFEAGYSYSKNIRVIPIGIGGVDVGAIPPPINLLQGFNLRNCEGINNLITILNGEFKTTFQTNVDEAQYKAIEFGADYLEIHRLNRCVDLIRCNVKTFANVDVVENPLEVVKSYFTDHGIQLCGINTSNYFVYGLEIINLSNDQVKRNGLAFYSGLKKSNRILS